MKLGRAPGFGWCNRQFRAYMPRGSRRETNYTDDESDICILETFISCADVKSSHTNEPACSLFKNNARYCDITNPRAQLGPQSIAVGIM